MKKLKRIASNCVLIFCLSGFFYFVLKATSHSEIFAETLGLTAIKLRMPSSRGLTTGSRESTKTLDPVVKPRDDGVLLMGLSAKAASFDLYPFPKEQQKQQFTQIITALRCLVCQNESLADSNADLAKDLRQRIYLMVLQGKNNGEISNYLVSRYGDFILLKPPFILRTYFLWCFPFVLVFVGFFILWRVAK